MQRALRQLDRDDTIAVERLHIEVLDLAKLERWAPLAGESELRASFARSQKVRTLNADANALADRSLIETTVRLHRAGDGAAYTGLRPAGADYRPAIPAAERAMETGGLSQVKVLLAKEIEQAPRCPHPLSPTGYLSHFIDADELNAKGGPVRFVTDWLASEAKSRAFITAEHKRL